MSAPLGQPWAAANILLPSADVTTELQLVVGASDCSQVTPESPEAKIGRADSKRLPSAEQATTLPVIGGFVIWLQETPPFDESQIGPGPPYSEVSSIVPSAELATDCPPMLCRHVLPRLVEIIVHVLKNSKPAMIFVPSAEQAIDVATPLKFVTVQSTPELVEIKS